MRLNFGKMNGVALAGMMAIGGAFAVTPQEAAAADKVGCITAEQCGLLAGAKGGPGTGVKDATLSIPIQVNEGTVIQNGKLTNGDHAVIPKIYLEGHVGDLSKYNGMIISIPVQNIGGDGKRAEFQIDTVRDGDELVVPVPKNFAGAHIASLGLASGHEWQVIRLAAKVCDWGTWIEPQQPAVVISEPVPEAVVQSEHLPEPVIVTPPPVETPPVVVEETPVRLTGNVADAATVAGIAPTNSINPGYVDKDGWQGMAGVNAAQDGNAFVAGHYQNGRFAVDGSIGYAWRNGENVLLPNLTASYDVWGERNEPGPVLTGRIGIETIGEQSSASFISGRGFTQLPQTELEKDIRWATAVDRMAVAGAEFTYNWDQWSVNAAAAYMRPLGDTNVGLSGFYTQREAYFGNNKPILVDDGWSARLGVEYRVNDRNTLFAGVQHNELNPQNVDQSSGCVGGCNFLFETEHDKQTVTTAGFGGNHAVGEKVNVQWEARNVDYHNAGFAGVKAINVGTSNTEVDLPGHNGQFTSLAFTATYQLNDRWQLGGKFAQASGSAEVFDDKWDLSSRSVGLFANRCSVAFKSAQMCIGGEVVHVSGDRLGEALNFGVPFDNNAPKDDVIVGAKLQFKF